MTKRMLRALPARLFLALFAIFSVFPLYFMLVSSTNTSQDVLGSRLIPGGELVNNFLKLAGSQPLSQAMWNSTVIAVGTTILTLLICSIAGYGFEVYHSKHKDILMGILLLAIMIPFAATMIPLFQLFAEAGLTSTAIAVIIPTISTPFLILLFRQATRAFPREMIEAARIDGVSELGIFFRMYIPTMKATYAAAAVVSFMNAWNNFLWPKVILINNESITMPMLISNLTAGYVTDYGVLMLAVALTSLPTMVLFLMLQRSFREGIVGAVK